MSVYRTITLDIVLDEDGYEVGVFLSRVAAAVRAMPEVEAVPWSRDQATPEEMIRQ